MKQTVKYQKGVFQIHGVCGQALPLLPSPFPSIFFFCFFSFALGSKFRAVTRLETFATQAMSSVTPAFALHRYALYFPLQYFFFHELAIMARMAMKLTLAHFAFQPLTADVIPSKISKLCSSRKLAVRVIPKFKNSYGVMELLFSSKMAYRLPKRPQSPFRGSQAYF